MYKNSPESNEEKSDLEVLKEIIQSVPSEIEREFSKGGNSWFACVTTRLQEILSYLEFAIQSHEIDEARAQEAMSKFVALGQRVRELGTIYPNEDEVVPDDIKVEILSKIDILN